MSYEISRVHAVYKANNWEVRTLSIIVQYCHILGNAATRLLYLWPCLLPLLPFFNAISSANSIAFIFFRAYSSYNISQ